MTGSRAHLSGCCDLNWNFCRSARVSQAKPTKKPAAAAQPNGPRGAAGVKVCVCTRHCQNYLSNFPAIPPVPFTHRVSKHLGQLLICNTLDAAGRSACSYRFCSQRIVHVHLGHSHRQEDYPAPQTLSAPEARQLERVPAGKSCSEACCLHALLVLNADACKAPHGVEHRQQAASSHGFAVV